MYVCLCNALNEAAVKDAVCAGARHPLAVHRHHGTKVDCGQCLCTMADLIREPEDEHRPPAFSSAAE